MSISAIAALVLEAGPAVIRGVSSLFGGSETANKVANVVEQVDKLTTTNSEGKRQAIEHELAKLNPDELIELNQLKVELEREKTRREEIAAQDRQADHNETQTTIREGDKSENWIVSTTRPLMALISTGSACYYVITAQTPDLMTAGFLIGLAATYMGVRYKEKEKGIAS